MSDEYITIPELTEIDSLNTDDLFLLSRSGEEKKIKLKSELDKKLDNTTSPDNAGKVVGVDEDGTLTFVEGGGGGSALVPDITQAEYDLLPPEEQNNGQIRHITDAPETPVPFAVVNDSKTTSANVWTAQGTQNRIDSAVETATEDLKKNIYNFDEEIIVGYVIQNNVKKPLYRKSFFFASLSNNTVISTDFNLNNCVIYNVHGSYIQSSKVYPFPCFRSGNAIYLSLSTTNMSALSDFTATNVNIIIEYTKTTD